MNKLWEIKAQILDSMTYAGKYWECDWQFVQPQKTILYLWQTETQETHGLVIREQGRRIQLGRKWRKACLRDAKKLK